MNTDPQARTVRLASLGDLLLDGSAEFNHLAWQTSPTFSGASARDDLASIHEWCHHELDNTTTYGLLLVYFATLSHHAATDRTRFKERLGELVTHCSVAHEVYATWYSVELLREQYDIDHLCDLLPSDYEAYYNYGEQIVSGINSPFLRRQTFLTVIRSCFEAECFSRFSFQLAKDFRLSDVRARDLPNARLHQILKAISPGIFVKWASEYCDQVSKHDAVTIRRAMEHAGADGLDFLSIEEADIVLGRFLSWLTSQWNQNLSAMGTSSNSYESHLKTLRPMTEDANARCQKIVIRPSTGDSNQSPESLRMLLRQADSEIVRNREHALPLVVTPIADLPRFRWADLAVGNDPSHLLVQARPVLSLRQQHVLELDSFHGALDESPIVFIRHREPPGTPGAERARAFELTQSSDLQNVVEATNGALGVGLVSSQLLGDSEWQSQWLIPSLFWVVKIDHSLHDFLHEHCRAQVKVLYSTSTINDGRRVIRFMCFLTLAEGETNWQLFIGFCSGNTAKACIGFINHALDSDRVIRDDTPFNSDLAPALRVVATHLIRDEHFFSFEHLSYL